MTDERLDIVRTLAAAGYCRKQIARQVNMQKPALDKYVRKQNIKTVKVKPGEKWRKTAKWLCKGANDYYGERIVYQ